MAIQSNQFAEVPEDSQITASAAAFIEQYRYDDIPSDALAIGRRCVRNSLESDHCRNNKTACT